MTLHLQFNLINMLRGTHSNEKTCEKTVDEKLLFVVDNGRVNESHDTNINFYLKKNHCILGSSYY